RLDVRVDAVDLIGLENRPGRSDRDRLRLPVNGGKLGIIGLGGIGGAAAAPQYHQSQHPYGFHGAPPTYVRWIRKDIMPSTAERTLEFISYTRWAWIRFTSSSVTLTLEVSSMPCLITPSPSVPATP